MPDKLIGAAAAAKRFRGSRATGYDMRRSGRAHWAKEHAAVESMLVDLPKGSLVLDMPVGTGRYASIYKQLGFRAMGVDASEDMLAVARMQIERIGYKMWLGQGDALNLGTFYELFDAAVCTRLVNWFLPDEMVQAVSELMRVTKDRVIISIEFGSRNTEAGNNPHDPAVWAAALKQAAAVEQRRVEITPGYWMIQLARESGPAMMDDKTLAGCVAKFDNQARFDGFRLPPRSKSYRPDVDVPLGDMRCGYAE